MTLAEIAKQANVSIATVSRIINNKGKVAEETRSRVMSIINSDTISERLYMADSNSKVILMCIPSLSNPFCQKVVKGIQDSAKNHGYSLFLYNEAEFSRGFSHYANIFKTGKYAGIVLQTPVTNSSFIDDLALRFPVVMCSEYYDKSSVPFVSIDNKSAAMKAVNYLISIGKKRIALMNTTIDRVHSKYRELGYRDALKKAKIDVDEKLIVHISSIDYSLALSYAYAILSLKDRPDAIFSISDVYAAAAINVAKKLNLRVPEDVAVVGFDDIDIASISSPSITTIRQPAYEIGFQSAELLVSKIERKPSVSNLILDTELIIRDSTSRN